MSFNEDGSYQKKPRPRKMKPINVDPFCDPELEKLIDSKIPNGPPSGRSPRFSKKSSQLQQISQDVKNKYNKNTNANQKLEPINPKNIPKQVFKEDSNTITNNANQNIQNHFNKNSMDHIEMNNFMIESPTVEKNPFNTDNNNLVEDDIDYFNDFLGETPTEINIYKFFDIPNEKEVKPNNPDVKNNEIDNDDDEGESIPILGESTIDNPKQPVQNEINMIEDQNNNNNNSNNKNDPIPDLNENEIEPIEIQTTDQVNNHSEITNDDINNDNIPTLSEIKVENQASVDYSPINSERNEIMQTLEENEIENPKQHEIEQNQSADSETKNESNIENGDMNNSDNYYYEYEYEEYDVIENDEKNTNDNHNSIDEYEYEEYDTNEDEKESDQNKNYYSDNDNNKDYYEYEYNETSENNNKDEAYTNSEIDNQTSKISFNSNNFLCENEVENDYKAGLNEYDIQSIHHLYSIIKSRMDLLIKTGKKHFPATKDNQEVILRLIDQSRACHEYHFLENRIKYFENENKELKIKKSEKPKKITVVPSKEAQQLSKDLLEAKNRIKALRVINRQQIVSNGYSSNFFDEADSIKIQNQVVISKEKQKIKKIQASVDVIQKQLDEVEKRINLMTQKRSNYSVDQLIYKEQEKRKGKSQLSTLLENQ